MNRSTRSLQLTSEGQVFLQGAREAIDALDAAVDRVAVQRTDAAGKVRISSGVAVGHRYILPLLPLLAELHPRIVPDIVFDDRRIDLVDHQADRIDPLHGPAQLDQPFADDRNRNLFDRIV